MHALRDLFAILATVIPRVFAQAPNLLLQWHIGWISFFLPWAMD